MPDRRRASLDILPLLLLLSFAGCVRYRAEPLDPAAHPAEYRARRLSDPRVQRYLEQIMGRAPTGPWSDLELGLSALLFRPELARDRAGWRAAKAAVTTAGTRPPPGAQADVERAVSGAEQSSPWVVSLAGLFTLELGGKRGARLGQARAAAAVAETELRMTTWRILQEVRRGAATLQQEERAVAQLSAELAALQDVRELEQHRFAEAGLTSTELARTAAEVQSARAALAAAQRRRITARAELARAVGVPPTVLQPLTVDSPRPSGCALLDTLRTDSLEHLALTHQPGIQQSLARYAVGEADLRLEVARQYPNLELGPGFIWDQGVNRWTLALALPGLLGRSNRGPIAEAKARRAVLGQEVYQAQEAALGQLGVASESCRGARLERSAADSEFTAAERSIALTRAAYDRGETGRTELARSQLALLRAQRTLRETEAGETVAGLELESATGEWRTESPVRWPDPRLPLLEQQGDR